MVYRYLEMEYRQSTEADISLQLQALQEDMRLELGRTSSSLSFLVDQVESHSPIRKAESMQRLSNDFLSLVRTSHAYDQVRLLDMSGKEVIRANYNNGKPTLAPEQALQDKSNRYYFQEGLKLKQHEVYASPFDLNIEHGEIEQPIKPTIRLVQPAFDPAGRQIGMLVVNVLGNQLLAHVETQSKVVPAESVSLLNQDGYWLVGPVRQDLWAFMYPGETSKSLAHREPEVWHRIRDNDQAKVAVEGGTYLSDTFYPARALGKAGLHVDRPGERVWKLVAYYPDTLLQTALHDQYVTVVSVSSASGVALAIILLGTLRLRRQSELRRAAEAMAHEQAMENEKSRAIVTIAGGVAHEFNNILACILGSTYLLRQQLADQPELNDRINAIEQQGERGAELVRHLMAFAQIGFLQENSLELNELVAEQVEAWRQTLPEHVALNTTIAATPFYLQADRSRLVAMLQQLLSNAADAVANTGAPQINLSLEAHRLQSESGEEQRCACLTVRDNGCGIAPENLPYVLDPFFTTKEPGSGAGMGMALVHGVVKALHGDIRVESSEGEGTVVRIYLPLKHAQESAGSPAA